MAVGIHPRIRLFAGNNLGNESSAGAAGGASKDKAQAIPKQLEALTWAEGRQIGWATANALAAEGDADAG